MTLNAAPAGTPALYFRREAATWGCDKAVVFIGEADSELCRSLVQHIPTLWILSMSDAGEWQADSEVTRRRQLVLIEDDGRNADQMKLLLARLRDTVCGRLIVWSATLSLSEALALGFRRLDRIPSLFAFDLADYKQTPDWFNSNHFAHPDRWGTCIE